MKTLKFVFYRILLLLYKAKRYFDRIIYTTIVKIIVKSFQPPLRVNAKTIVTRNTTLGKNTNFNGMTIIGCGEVRIGDNFHSGNGIRIIAQNHNYKGEAIPYDEKEICKDVIIEDNVWIGDNVIILGGVTIGEGAIIQAGSVVVNNIPKYAIAGGHPAKKFKERDIKHYLDLKKNKKFH